VVTDKVNRVIADGPFNTKTNSDFVRDEIGAVLYTPINPKNISVPSEAGIKGIDHFTKNGVPICAAGLPLEMKGRELTQKRYIWGPSHYHQQKQGSSRLFTLSVATGLLSQGSGTDAAHQSQRLSPDRLEQSPAFSSLEKPVPQTNRDRADD